MNNESIYFLDGELKEKKLKETLRNKIKASLSTTIKLPKKNTRKVFIVNHMAWIDVLLLISFTFSMYKSTITNESLRLTQIDVARGNIPGILISKGTFDRN